MTRIIAGMWRSRRLNVPKGRDIRPTTDRMRERLFSMILHRVPALEGARVLDLFAGTGALGLEALSRGAAHGTFVEQSPASLTCLKGNIEALEAGEQTRIIKGSATRLPPAPAPVDLVFLDPPYRKGLFEKALTNLLETGWISGDSLIIGECASDETLDLAPDFEILDERTQGQQRILFLKRQDARGV